MRNKNFLDMKYIIYTKSEIKGFKITNWNRVLTTNRNGVLTTNTL